MSPGELASHLPGGELDASTVRRIVDLGLVEPVDGSTDLVVRSPSFLRIGSELAALERLGPLAEEVVRIAVRQALQAVAERFVEREAARLEVDIPRPGASAS